MGVHPDHELEVLEEDQTVPPRPEEVIADADRPRDDAAATTEQDLGDRASRGGADT
ncbi:hypothetical protein [Ornithinimicrobium tianjinense]|uniref:Uncharacterized protein n=1 Tax=Ornithinimicrobium tianjinense TaxID=1195761 RepID=A0A917BTV6_9MICO|nr:hypothetical protein [Ornithinimicrobium tianjinense]GGF58513.1 hypothetical protein GCM10011366_27910 [Ornithinimicrobium tianjinense]